MTRRILRIFATKTGNIEIDYVDYTVARNFMVAIDQWYKAVKHNKTAPFIEFLQDKSEQFSSIFKIFTLIIVIAVIFINREILINASSSNDVLFSLSLISFGVVYISGLVAAKLGSVFENAVDSHQAISGLHLNRGDELALEEFKEANAQSIRSALVSVVLIVTLNLFSAYMASLLSIGS